MDINCGLLQGSVQGPVLFSLYMLLQGQLIWQHFISLIHWQLYLSFKLCEINSPTTLDFSPSRVEQWMVTNCLQSNSKVLIFTPQLHKQQIWSSLGFGNSKCRVRGRERMSYSRARHMFKFNDTKKAIHAFISSCLDYLNSLFTIWNTHSVSQLQLILDSSTRLLIKSWWSYHINLNFSTTTLDAHQF